MTNISLTNEINTTFDYIKAMGGVRLPIQHRETWVVETFNDFGQKVRTFFTKNRMTGEWYEKEIVQK